MNAQVTCLLAKRNDDIFANVEPKIQLLVLSPATESDREKFFRALEVRGLNSDVVNGLKLGDKVTITLQAGAAAAGVEIAPDATAPPPPA